MAAAVPITPPRPEPKAAFVRRFVTPEGVDLRLTLATAGERAGAFLLDLIIIFVILVVMTIAAAWLASLMGVNRAEPVLVIWLLGSFVLRSGWFILFELTPRAATPGKRILGLRVAARDGGRLTGEAVFVRNAMREIEVFLPGIVLLLSGAAGEPVDAWMTLLALAWTGIFMFFLAFNRDRLRVGDFVAGTWVVKAPRQRLAVDLAGAPSAAASLYVFTAEQIGAYGVKELQVLEEVLRQRDKRTVKAVAERIRKRIAWRPLENEIDADFLTAYYAALRGRLEQRLLFGHRRRDKFDKA
jgi:uncharacterized RDD family membrane protein YckC